MKFDKLKNRAKEYFELAIVCIASIALAIFGFLIVLALTPTFWLIMIFIVLLVYLI